MVFLFSVSNVSCSRYLHLYWSKFRSLILSRCQDFLSNFVFLLEYSFIMKSTFLLPRLFLLIDQNHLREGYLESDQGIIPNAWGWWFICIIRRKTIHFAMWFDLYVIFLWPDCISFEMYLCSSQSRADLLALGLAVTNILAGLVWLSIRPKSISKVWDLFSCAQ